jgi:hypothetical protein
MSIKDFDFILYFLLIVEPLAEAVFSFPRESGKYQHNV